MSGGQTIRTNPPAQIPPWVNLHVPWLMQPQLQPKGFYCSRSPAWTSAPDLWESAHAWISPLNLWESSEERACDRHHRCHHRHHSTWWLSMSCSCCVPRRSEGLPRSGFAWRVVASARRVGGLAVVASVPIPMTLSFDMASIHMGLMTLSSLAVAVAASVPVPLGPMMTLSSLVFAVSLVVALEVLASLDVASVAVESLVVVVSISLVAAMVPSVLVPLASNSGIPARCVPPTTIGLLPYTPWLGEDRALAKGKGSATISAVLVSSRKWLQINPRAAAPCPGAVAADPPFPPIPVLLRPSADARAAASFRSRASNHLSHLSQCFLFQGWPFRNAPGRPLLYTSQTLSDAQSTNRFFHTRTKAVTLIHMRADHTNPPYTDDTRQLATGRPSHIHMRADDTDQSYTTNIDQFSLSTRPHPHEARLALHRTCNHREAEIPTQFLFSHKSPEM